MLCLLAVEAHMAVIGYKSLGKCPQLSTSDIVIRYHACDPGAGRLCEDTLIVESLEVLVSRVFLFVLGTLINAANHDIVRFRLLLR